MAKSKRSRRAGESRWLPRPREISPELARIQREARSLLSEDEENAEYPNLAEELARDGFVKDRVYLRFGGPPEGGRSYVGNPWISYSLEPGVSVFKGRMMSGGDYLLELGSLELRHSLWRLAREARPAYFARGTPIGRGACGEPCLGRKARYEPVPPEAIIASIPPSAALEFWHGHHGDFLSTRLARRRLQTD